MNILIFDDDMSTVQMLKSKIDWDRLGITEIYTAYSINQAKDIFIKNPDIDIMLSDIEAPGGTGIDLLKWVREQSFKTENIFLTNHADFSYAKEAIQLDCVDYIIKMSPLYSIEDAIKKAINKVKLNRLLLQYKFYEEYWSQNHSLVTEQFWRELLLTGGPVKKSELVSIVNGRKVDVDLNDKYCMVLISSIRTQNANQNDEDPSHGFVIKNLALQIILNGIESGSIISMEKETKRYLSLIVEESKKISKEKLMKNCEEFISFCNENLGCNLNCYIGNSVSCENIGLLEKKLEDMDMDNVCHINKVFVLPSGEKSLKTNTTELPDIWEWADMLKKDRKSTLFISIKKYIDEAANKSEIDAGFMNAFRHDFLQMLLTVLGQEHIQAHEFFSDEKPGMLYKHAVNSVYDMLKWVDFSINKASDYIKECGRLKTLIDQVKEYIDMNYNKNITRDELANRFYLNPDYLSRIFNRETGMSIPEYLSRLRISKAAQLIKTGKNISEVAALVGYDNYSYFSTIYKKIEGITPVAYRKKCFAQKTI